jgi:acetoacetate decarboxylase
MATPKEAFVPHKNAPGPARLEVEKADNSGVVNADPQFMADRLAIQNHVMAYSYLIDEGRWDDWFALFSDDISFETTVPSLGSIVIKGQEAFRAFVDIRYIQPGKTSKGVRRHTQGNFHVTEQTATTAKARAYMTISSVPAGDHMHDVTTGTYNANLEKRDGRWTITRWYVETDAPVSPSGFPPGFEKQITAAADPYNKLPGAPEVATPVKGKITLANHPFSMPANGPLFNNAPVWNWNGIDIIIFDYLTDENSAAAMLPEQCTTLPIPDLPGFSAVKHVWAVYPDSSFGPYNEFFPGIPCLFEGQLFIYVPFIYVDNDSACAAGREIGGWPKKMADIKIDRVANEYRCSIERRGKRFASASMNVGGKLFSTPLPADKNVTLSYPYNMTFPLPPATGKEQPDVALPSASLKLFPGVNGSSGKPALAQLIAGPWRMKGTFSGGSGAAIGFGKSEDDPCYKLPVLKLLGAMHFEGDMTLALSEMSVLHDLLKK